MLGSTWFLAHVVASTCARARHHGRPRRRSPDGQPRTAGRAHRSTPGLAGLLFGLAATARLTTILAAPFFVFVGGGGSIPATGLSAGIGAAIPVLLLLAYNLATTGQVFHPGYEHLYQTEYTPVPSGALAQLFARAPGHHLPPGRLGPPGPALHPPEPAHHAGLAAGGPARVRARAARPGLPAAAAGPPGHEPLPDQPRLAAGRAGRHSRDGGGAWCSARPWPSPA